MKRISTLLLLIAIISPTNVYADDEDTGLNSLVDLIGKVDDADFQYDLLLGMHEALAGRLNVPAPKGWTETYLLLAKSDSEKVRETARELALVFGDENARNELKAVLRNTKATTSEREKAIDALTRTRTPELSPILIELLDDNAVCGAALRALAAFGDDAIADAIIERFPKFSADQQRDAVTTLAARIGSARKLVSALEKKHAPISAVSAYNVRQLQAFGDAELEKRVTSLWGATRPSSDEIKKQMASYKLKFTPKRLSEADLSQGRHVFKETCSSCHVLYGDGGKIGPDITGSNRNNIDYLLENILDPSASVAKPYQVSSIITDEGRVISGIVGRTTGGVVEIQTLNEKLTIDEDTIDVIRPSEKSMMPDGLIEKLSAQQFRDLIAYLSAMKQVDLPEQAANPLDRNN